MNKHIPVLIGLVLCCSSLPSYSQSDFPPTCTTTEKIHFPISARIPPNLSREQTREAVLVALGYADVNVSWARDFFSGQWFFELEDDYAIYAGYSVRSYYLQIAVLLDDSVVTTIVCDSRNLDQSARKIHRKVPVWKGTLDDNIRLALGQAAEYYRRHDQNEGAIDMAKELENLESLRRSGVLTDDEYETLRQRVIDRY